MATEASHEKIVVVGAGLVGSLAAIYLAKHGYQVDVYERRPDMRKEKISAGRSINLAVSTRGLHALREVGLEEKVLEQAIPMKGRMIHSIKGDLTFQPYGTKDSEYINSVSRGGLNQLLMSEAEKYSKVAFHFNRKVSGMDFKKGVLKFEDPAGEERVDRVIATDGSASLIRVEMMKQYGAKCSEEYLEYGYKELLIPPGPGGRFQMEKNALHIWPRGTFMLIALPNFDASFTCTLFLPNKGTVSFESLQSREQVSAFFNEYFRDAVHLMPGLVETFMENPTGHMVTVKCFPWGVDDKALLLGDAAHAIVPFFGQGMNCGFEDLTVLEEYMKKCKTHGKIDWAALFDEFPRHRKPDSDSIADMAVENFVEMRDKVGNPRFLLEKAVEKVLQREFPKDYVSRYSMVSFSRVPYRFAAQAGTVQDEILRELSANIQSAEQVDLKRAGELIRMKLVPVWNKLNQE